MTDFEFRPEEGIDIDTYKPFYYFEMLVDGEGPMLVTDGRRWITYETEAERDAAMAAYAERARALSWESAHKDAST